MRRIFLLALFCQLNSYAFSQKIQAEIVKGREAGISEWQILDGDHNQVFCGDEYSGDDSVSLALEANRRYFLKISVSFISNRLTNLYYLLIDGEPILIISSDIETGEHYYPFFTGTRSPITKIIGGSDVSISNYPWQVYIVAGNYLCGGSIIGPDWVVTAAHCVKHNGIITPASIIKVTAGSTYPRDSGTNYSISEVIVHDQYNLSTFEYDIALLKIKGSINCTDCMPIKLMNAYNVEEGFTDPGTMATVTGWGLTNVDRQTLPNGLQMAKVPIVSNQTASAIWGTIPSTDIMAGYRDGNKDACSGDSGGPMSIGVEKENKLAGIVSWGSSNCNTYGGYTRVSMLESWIRSKTGIIEYALSSPTGDSVVCQSDKTSNYSAEVVTGTPTYEWELLPTTAGTISWISQVATVTWNTNFTGSVTIKVRTLTDGKYSEWGRKKVIRAVVTKIIGQTKDTVICEKDTLDLQTMANGTSLRYDWSRNDTLVQSGDIDHLYFPGAIPKNSGIYRCQVTGLCGSLSTNSIALTVHPLTLIHGISPDITSDYGSDIKLENNATGHDLLYLWKQNDEPLANSNSALLLMQNVNAKNIGLYKTVVTGTCGTETSDSIYVYLRKNPDGEGPEISIWPTITTGEVNIACSTPDYYEIRIINISGRLMYHLNNCQYKTNIDINRYAKGIYIMNIKGKWGSKSVKVVKD